MNRAILIGRLTKNPELRTTSNGNNICNFSIAVTRNYKNTDGEYEADFINCIAFKKTGELINQYCSKGNQLAVEGRIQTGSFTDKNGVKRYTTDIAVDKVTFLEKKNAQKNENTVQKETENTVEKDPFEEFGEQVSLDDNEFLD